MFNEAVDLFTHITISRVCSKKQNKTKKRLKSEHYVYDKLVKLKLTLVAQNQF